MVCALLVLSRSTDSLVVCFVVMCFKGLLYLLKVSLYLCESVRSPIEKRNESTIIVLHLLGMYVALSMCHFGCVKLSYRPLSLLIPWLPNGCHARASYSFALLLGGDNIVSRFLKITLTLYIINNIQIVCSQSTVPKHQTPVGHVLRMEDILTTDSTVSLVWLAFFRDYYCHQHINDFTVLQFWFYDDDILINMHSRITRKSYHIYVYGYIITYDSNSLETRLLKAMF